MNPACLSSTFSGHFADYTAVTVIGPYKVMVGPGCDDTTLVHEIDLIYHLKIHKPVSDDQHGTFFGTFQQ
jgi:hypothetical protein